MIYLALLWKVLKMDQLLKISFGINAKRRGRDCVDGKEALMHK